MPSALQRNDIVAPARIVISGNAVFCNEQFTVEAFMHPAHNVLHTFRIILIAHLGHFAISSRVTLAVGIKEGACVGLHTKEIILLDTQLSDRT